MEKWHSIGAGRVGDKYKGGKIVEMDMKNSKAKVAKSKALKNKHKHLKVRSETPHAYHLTQRHDTKHLGGNATY